MKKKSLYEVGSCCSSTLEAASHLRKARCLSESYLGVVDSFGVRKERTRSWRFGPRSSNAAARIRSQVFAMVVVFKEINCFLHHIPS